MGSAWDILQSQPLQGAPPPPSTPSGPSDWDIVSSQPHSEASSGGGFLHDVWQEGVVNPAKQVSSGYFRASAGAAHMLGNAADIAGKVTHTQPGGFFRDAEDYYGQQADELSGGRKDVASQIYQGIGAAPVEIAKYGVASAALGPVAGMAATDALSAADKGPKQALIAGAKGALTGKALGLMAPASTPARVAGGAAMFGGQTALEGGSPWDIVSSSITGGVMGATAGPEKEAPEPLRAAPAQSPIEEMPTPGLARMLQVETDPAKRSALVAEARNRGIETPAEQPAPSPAEASAQAISAAPDYPSLFDQAEKRLAAQGENRQTRRESAAVPETGVPENVARVQDARDRLAQRLAGTTFAELSNSDRSAVDDLIRQGYGLSAMSAPVTSPAAPTPLPAAESRAALANRGMPRRLPQPSMPPPESGEPKGVESGYGVANSESPVQSTAAPNLLAGGVGEGRAVQTNLRPSRSAISGNAAAVEIPGSDFSYPARYQVRELGEVQPSHNPFTFQPNPEYMLENDRNYGDPANQERIVLNSVPGAFKPSRVLTDNPTATNGPSVIDENGNVLGGNNRAMLLARVYQNDPETGQQYKAMLAAKAPQFGIDPQAVMRMERPVLVREVPNSALADQAQRAVTDMNKSEVSAHTAAERATSDARTLDQPALDYLHGVIESAGPEATLNEALSGPRGAQIVNTLVDHGVFTPQEKPLLVDPNSGALTAAAKDRISKMMLGRLFRDSGQYQNTAPELRNKLERIVAPLSQVQGRAEWDVTPHVQEAVDLLEDARAHNTKNLQDLLAQGGMFGAANYSPEAVQIADTLRQSPVAAARAFRQYAQDEALSRPGQSATFFEPPGQKEAFEQAFIRGGGERGGISADLLTAPARAVGLDKFLQQDVIPGMSGAARKATGAIDDIRTLLAPQTRGPLAQKAAGMIRERGANLAQARDRAVKALQNGKAYFDANDPNYNLRFIDAVEKGNTDQLPPQERQFAGTMRQLIDQRSESLRTLGLLNSFYENYFPHLWRDPQLAANWLQSWLSKRPMAGSEAYRKQRTYPTMMDGINDPDFHMEPAFTNPVDFVTAKLGEMDKSITAHQIVNDLKSAGDLQPLPNGQKPPAGTARIDDRIASGYVGPEQLATVINNHLSPGVSQSPLFQVWRGLNNTMNMIDLSLSYYHGLTTTLNSSLSDMALGLKQAAAGKPLEGATAVARGFTPFASVVQDVMKGTKLLKVWDGEPAPDPMTQALVDAVKSGGGRARQESSYAQNYANGFLQALRSYNLPGAAIRLPFAALEKAMAPLMEYMVPRAKLGAFAKRAQMEIEQNPNMTPDQARQTFGKLWDSIDNRFGQFVYGNMFMNKIAKDLMMAVVGRPGWNIGTVREIGGGMADLAKAATAPLRGAKPELSDRAAFTTALFLGGAAINGLLNYVLTGTPPQGVDYIAPRDGGMNEDGRPSRIVLPTYLSKDLYSYATRPLATLKAKAAPALTVASDLLTNRDFQNRKILGREGTGLGEYARNAVTPYAVQGVQKNIERGESPARVALPLAGVMPAGKQVGKSKAEELMAEYQQEAMPTTRTPQSERNQLKGRITTLVRSGKQDVAHQVASEAYTAGKLTDDDINHALDRAEFSPLVADFKRINLDQAFDVMEIATPSERQQLLPELAGRLGRTFDRLPPQEQARIEGRIQKLNLGGR